MKLLYSQIFGKGPPILVFHGLFGNSNNWISFAQRFSKYYQVHLLDIRNHGKSFHSEKMDYDSMSKDILDYIQFYNLNDPILLGHSIGGRLIIHFSIKNPLIPKKIIIIDITFKSYNNKDNKNFIKILKKVNFHLIKNRRDLDFFLKKWILETKIRLFFSKSTGRDQKGKLYFLFNLSAIEKNYNLLIHKKIVIHHKYYGSTLFLKGEKSNYILSKDYKIIKNFFPNSSILIIQNSGHWIHIENSVDFYKEICIFLNKK